MEFLESLVSKVSHPREVKIEYNCFKQQHEIENYKEFNKYVEM